MVPTLKFPAPNRYVCGDEKWENKVHPSYDTAASSMTSKRCAAKQPAATLSALVVACLLRCSGAFFLPSTDAGKAALPGNKPTHEGSSVARKVVVPDAERSRSTGLSAFGGVRLEWDGAADRTALFGGAVNDKSSSLVARETDSDDDGEESRRAMMASALGQRGADGGGTTAIEASGIGGGGGAGERWRKGLRSMRSAVIARILKRGDSTGGRGGNQVPILTATSTSAG